MKKLVLSVAIAAIATLNANAQVSFGIQAGANLATTKSEDKSVTPTVTERGKSKVGFVAGLVADIPFSSSLSFRPEVNFIQKGGKYSSTETIGGTTYSSSNNFNLNFIEVPLNVVFSLPAGPGRFCVGAGPDISFGISGKSKYNSTISGQGFPTQNTSDESKVKFDGKKYSDLPVTDMDSHLKRVDFGANAFVGYKLNMGLFFNAGYTYGFSDIDPNDDYSFRTAGLTLKVGFLFGGKSSKNDD